MVGTIRPGYIGSRALGVEESTPLFQKHCVRMFSLFSKSKGVAKHNSDEKELKQNVSGSQGTLNIDRDDILSRSPFRDSQLEVRSSLSANIKSSENKKYKKNKGRSRNFRGLFNSDCEDEIQSVVSDNPQLYHRSSSMVSSPSFTSLIMTVFVSFLRGTLRMNIKSIRKWPQFCPNGSDNLLKIIRLYYFLGVPFL